MPDNIPTGESAPSVQTQALPTPYDGNQASPTTFGAPIGDVDQQVGALANHIAVVAKDKANAAAVLAARGAADGVINSNILSDTTGFRGLHGHDAMQGADKAITNVDKSLKEIGSNLSNEEQQAAFAHYALAKKEEAFRHVQNHLAQESTRIEAKSYDLAQKALLGGLSALPVAIDPDERKAKIASAELAARARAYQIYGKSATQAEVDDFTIPARSNAVRQVLETLIANEGEPGALTEAKKVIADPAVVGLLGGAHVAILEGRINRRADAQEGRAAAVFAANGAQIPGTALISEAASDALLEKIAGMPGSRPEMLKIAQDELKRFRVAGQQAQKARNDAAYGNGITAIRKGDEAAYNAAIDVLSVPDGDGGEKQRSLIEFRTAQARRDSRDPALIREQLSNLNDAETAVAHITDPNMTLDSFLAQKMPNGQPLAQGLSIQGTAKIGALLQKRLKQMETEKPLDQPTVKQITSTVQDAMDFPTTGGVALTDEQRTQLNQIKTHVRDQRNAWVADNPNKTPDANQVQEWIDEMVGKVPGTSAHWYSGDKRRVDIEIERADARKRGADGGAPIPTPFPRPKPPPPPAQPTQQDSDALDWLNDPKNAASPAAAGVRAKLKAKGLVP